MTPREISDAKEAEAKAKREANPEAAVLKECEYRKPVLIQDCRQAAGESQEEASATTCLNFRVKRRWC